MPKVVAVQVCTNFSTSSDGVTSCSAFEWQQAYLIPPEASGAVDLLLTGGFDWDVFLQFFGGTLTMFAVGFGTGLLLSQVRKIRRL